jgi:hypothetical protein
MLENNAPLRLSILVATMLVISGCDRDEPKPPAPAIEPPSPAIAPGVLTPPVVNRAALIQAANAIASAEAAGSPAVGESLAGRRFVIRQAFGCSTSGGAGPEGTAGYAWGPEKKVVNLSLTPADWDSAPLMVGAGDWEAVQGYWITRPWMLGEGCPARPAQETGDTPVSPSPMTLGLAAVHAVDSSRLGRRTGRSLDFAVRGADGQAPIEPVQGYGLVLEGRFVAGPDGRSLRCRSEHPDRRPVCVALTEMDRIAFTDASGAVLAEWRGN